MEKVDVNKNVLHSIEGEDLVLVVVTATKPDFYKQWSLLPTSKKLGVKSIIINTGQHYDDLLGYGLKEFKMDEHIAFNLNIRGNLHSKVYEMIAKAGFVARHLKAKYPQTTFVPIVHGDTLAAGLFPIGWMFSVGQKVAQNEAGLRGMAPIFSRDVETYIENQFKADWHLARQEPFPEQWDTFVAGASSELQFAPTSLNAEHLIREGNPEDRIFTVGNSVVDAMKFAKRNLPEVSVFEEFPKLEEYDNWIRADIHRRVNLTEQRFKTIFKGIENLVREGQPVVWIELPGTKFAVEKYGLEKKIRELEAYDHFMYTPLWRDYAQVMEFLRSGNCLAELTDSGSMQEELNELGVPCFTVRYNTDRPETIFEAESNLLVPPNEALFSKMLDYLVSQEELIERLKHGKKLYGSDVGIKIVQKIKSLHNEGELNLLRTVPEVDGIVKNEGGIDFL